MRRDARSILLALVLLSGCGAVGGGSGRVLIQGAGTDELVKLRTGPGLGYGIVLGLPDGTPLERHDCVTEVGQLWCRVSLPAAPRVTGYVSADYLSAS